MQRWQVISDSWVVQTDEIRGKHVDARQRKSPQVLMEANKSGRCRWMYDVCAWFVPVNLGVCIEVCLTSRVVRDL